MRCPQISLMTNIIVKTKLLLSFAMPDNWAKWLNSDLLCSPSIAEMMVCWCSFASLYGKNSIQNELSIPRPSGLYRSCHIALRNCDKKQYCGCWFIYFQMRMFSHRVRLLRTIPPWVRVVSTTKPLRGSSIISTSLGQRLQSHSLPFRNRPAFYQSGPMWWQDLLTISPSIPLFWLRHTGQLHWPSEWQIAYRR